MSPTTTAAPSIQKFFSIYQKTTDAKTGNEVLIYSDKVQQMFQRSSRIVEQVLGREQKRLPAANNSAQQGGVTIHNHYHDDSWGWGWLCWPRTHHHHHHYTVTVDRRSKKEKKKEEDDKAIIIAGVVLSAIALVGAFLLGQDLQRYGEASSDFERSNRELKFIIKCKEFKENDETALDLARMKVLETRIFGTKKRNSMIGGIAKSIAVAGACVAGGGLYYRVNPVFQFGVGGVAVGLLTGAIHWGASWVSSSDKKQAKEIDDLLQNNGY